MVPGLTDARDGAERKVLLTDRQTKAVIGQSCSLANSYKKTGITAISATK